MRSTDAGAGQHSNGQFGRHSHVDGDTVAFFHAQRLKHVRELLYFAMQLLVGESANLSRLTLPDDGGFVLARGLDMAVEEVVRAIDLTAYETFSKGITTLQNFIPFLERVQF